MILISARPVEANAPPPQSVGRRSRRGFTLLELIVVLTLLSTVLALAAPRLGRFMAGRDVVEEARRALSLTRHARAEAISRGERLQLWFNPADSHYGLRSDLGDAYSDFKAIEFTCRDGLTLRVDANSLDDESLAAILFWPDGAIDADSVERVEILEDDAPAFAIARAENGMEYALEDLRGTEKTREAGTQ